MGRTRRCSGSKTPLSEHAFGKLGKGCIGPEQSANVSVVEEDTAPPSQSRPVEDGPKESIEALCAQMYANMLNKSYKTKSTVSGMCARLARTNSHASNMKRRTPTQ